VVLSRLAETREKEPAREQSGMRSEQGSQIPDIATEEISRSPLSSHVLAAVDCGFCLVCSISFCFFLRPATWQMALNFSLAFIYNLRTSICLDSTASACSSRIRSAYESDIISEHENTRWQRKSLPPTAHTWLLVPSHVVRQQLLPAVFPSALLSAAFV
jgi:hypothetical protein